MEEGVAAPREVFRIGEEEACRFLRKNKCKILCRNYRTSGGEIDIVAQWKKIIVFVEVKTRTSTAYTQPWEAVGYRKRKNVKAAAKAYVMENAVREHEFRFDVISIVLDPELKPTIEWIQNAF
jgi:putative endonuclease